MGRARKKKKEEEEKPKLTHSILSLCPPKCQSLAVIYFSFLFFIFLKEKIPHFFKLKKKKVKRNKGIVLVEPF